MARNLWQRVFQHAHVARGSLAVMVPRMLNKALRYHRRSRPDDAQGHGIRLGRQGLPSAIVDVAARRDLQVHAR
jgi:hypothetical protein